MKNNVLKISLVILSAAVLATPVLAATTVSFSPANVSVSQGKTFSVTVAIDPQGVSNYTAKIQLDYPADVLEIKSFTLGSNWMALAQPGYDLIDNTNGVLIKTGGYPGGLSQTANFGTVSFYAKKVGSGTIKLGNGALALDANNQNVLSGAPSVSVAVTAPVSAPATPQTPTTPVETPATPQQPVEQPITQPVVAQTSLAAAIGNVLSLGTGSGWVGTIVTIIILAIIVYVVYALIQRKRKGGFGKV